MTGSIISTAESNQLMDEWIDVIQRKQELVQKEAQLMLQLVTFNS